MKMLSKNLKKQRKKIVLTVTIALFALTGHAVKAQTQSDLIVSASKTADALCGNNGEIKITYTANTHPTATVDPANVEYNLYDANGVSVTNIGGSGFTTNSTIGGLSKGVFTPCVKALFSNGVIVTSYGNPVTITDNGYVPLTASFTVLRNAKTLNCRPTGQVRIVLQNGSGSYSVSLEKLNAATNVYETVAGPRTDLQKNQEWIIDNLAAGTYRAIILDVNCSVSPKTDPIVISNVAQDYVVQTGLTYERLRLYEDNNTADNPDCNKLYIRAFSGTPAPELSYYIGANAYLFYEYAAYSDRDFTSGGGSVDKNDPSSWSWKTPFTDVAVKAEYVMPAGVTYDLMRTDATYRPNFYIRVKQTDTTKPTCTIYTIPRTSISYNPLSVTFDITYGANCNLQAKLNASYNALRCMPVNYYIRELHSNYTIVNGKRQYTYLNGALQYSVVRERAAEGVLSLAATDYVATGLQTSGTVNGTPTEVTHYELVATSADGQVYRIMKEFLTPRYDTQYTFGSSLSRNEGLIKVNVFARNGSTFNFSGVTITLKEAPSGYTPQSNMVALGESYTIRDGETQWPLSLFAKYHASDPLAIVDGRNGGYGGDNESGFFSIAPGSYKFEIKDKCGNIEYARMDGGQLEAYFPNYQSGVYGQPPAYYQNHIAVPRAQTYQYKTNPVLETVNECSKVRVYPFKNNIDMIKRLDQFNPSGVNAPVHLYVIAYPQGMTINNVYSTQPDNDKLRYLYFDPAKAATADPAANAAYLNSLYFEFNKTTTVANAEYTIGIYPRTTGAADRLNYSNHTLKVNVSDQSLSYDPQRYYAYRCSAGGSTGKISIRQLNGLGDTFDYFLYDDVPVTAATPIVQSVTGVAKNKSAEFTTFTGIGNSGFVRIKIVDNRCLDFVIVRVPLYSIESPSIVQLKDHDVKFCVGETVHMEIISLGDPEVTSYTWILPDGTTQAGRELHIPNAQPRHSGIYTAKITPILCGGGDNILTKTLIISVAPLEMWWRYDAASSDWNSIYNWEDKYGRQIFAVPAVCTTVHLPGKVKDGGFFPELRLKDADGGTTRSVFGNPECDTIYFHHGSELDSPHLLKYRKAVVEYNFGYYNNGVLTNKKDVSHPYAYEPLLPLERNRWYMLGAPLKNMASGDFGFAGFPKAYQRLFKTAVLPLGAILKTGEFSEPFSTLGYKLSENNNALALKIDNLAQSSNQRNLNAMEGIVQLPFFNRARATMHPLHRYAGGRSYFRYYNEDTLYPLNKEDNITRGEEAYRFVFEDDVRNQIGTVTVSGKTVQGYAMPLKGGGAGKEIMIGNPIMTMIDFDKLVVANSDRMEPWYKIFSAGEWKIYHTDVTQTNTLTRLIVPMQGLVIQLKGNFTELYFPLDGAYDITTKEQFSSIPTPGGRSAETRAAQPVSAGTFFVEATNPNGVSRAVVSWDSPSNNSVPKTVHPDYPEYPQAFFIGSELDVNAIQFEKTNRGKIPFGYYSSTLGEVSLSVENIDRSVMEKLVLEDRVTGARQDLLANNRYSFRHNIDMEGGRFLLHVKRFGIDNIDNSILLDDRISVSLQNGMLRAEAPDNIQSVEVYDLLGRKIDMLGDVRSNYINKSLSLPKGVYLIRVFLMNGEVKVEKLYVN